MLRLLTLALLGALITACAAPAQRGIPESDNSPADHRQPTTAAQGSAPDVSSFTLEELNRQGQALMQEKQWESAIACFSRAAILTSDPHDEYYNLACCNARLGKQEQAVDFLTRARETGVVNYPFVVADADLALLKGFKPFDDFMAAFKTSHEAARRAQGEALYIQVPALNEIRVRLPQGFDKSRRYPLVIGLHEYGGNARDFAPLYDSISYKDDFIFAAIDAPYAVPAADENAGGRWWWLYDAPDDGWMRSRTTTVQLVLAARQRLLADYPIDEKNIYLLGYRQGGTAAMLVCSTEWKNFAGFIAVGSHHLGDEPKLDAGFACLLCHGRADEKLKFEYCKEAREIWTRGGAIVTVEELTKWQEIDADATSAIAAWLHDCISDRSGE